MRIHHFNPEHEICLASGRSNYTPPHAATRLRSGLGWMPALWAEKGDIVLVDDSDYAKKAAQRWRDALPEVHFLTFSELKSMLRHISMDTLQLSISPWGWDLPLRQQLLRSGVPASHLPTLKEMDAIRTLEGQIPSPINPPPGCAFHERCAYACERCRSEVPQQRDLGSGHMVSCIRAEELKSL